MVGEWIRTGIWVGKLQACSLTTLMCDSGWVTSHLWAPLTHMASIIDPFSFSEKATVCFNAFRSGMQEGHHPTDYLLGILLYLQQFDSQSVIKL